MVKQKVTELRKAFKYAVMGVVCSLLVAVVPALAAVDDSTVQEARDALRVRDAVRLQAARDALLAAGHPLAPWADYWYFQLRLGQASPSEVDEFLNRWPDAYVADRARNDWLLELGRRKDWRTFLRIQPTFKMNDDREVRCLGVLARYQTNVPMEAPGDWQEQARQAWWGQKDADYGCDAMAQTLLSAGVLTQADVWRKLRLSIEADKPRAVTQSARLLGETLSRVVARLMGEPQQFLMPTAVHASAPPAHSVGRRHHAPGASMGPTPRAHGKAKGKRHTTAARAKPSLAPLPTGIPAEDDGPLNLLAFIRWASLDPAGAAQALSDAGVRARWKWDAEASSWAWAELGRAAALRLLPEAPDYFDRALADRAIALGGGELSGTGTRLTTAWSPEVLAWMARASVRAATSGQVARWEQVETAIDAMTPEQQQDTAWLYWKARALLIRARLAGHGGDAWRQQAHELLRRVASPVTFYGQLAAEELYGGPMKAPGKPIPPTETELAQARALPGIDRAFRLIELGLRSEGVREWNFTLAYGRPGGLSERELLAVAEEACQREIWDRCISASDRTRQEIDLAQRYPMPFKEDVVAAAQEVGLDPAYMYGLIRQESRFIVAAKSAVGAAGLMQVMPATAAWTARKLRIDYAPHRIADRQTNLRIGAGYLKLVLDNFQGTQALAAAAYNAGPARSRRWREGVKLDAAAWVENIPFNETRDYVKKVLANATVYAHLLDGRPLSVRARLGAVIGPRASDAPPMEEDLP